MRPSPPKFEPIHLSVALLRAPVAPQQFVVKPPFPCGCVAELSGGHGIGKSTIALQLCLSVASGHSWAGLPTKCGRAVFASREDSAADLLRRTQAWLAAVPRNERARVESEIADRLTLLGRSETSGLKLTRQVLGRTVVDAAAVALVAERCKGADLIVLETASRLHAGSEDNDALTVLGDALEQLAEMTGAAVVLVRHVSKSAARTKETDSYAGRGGGALSDAVRSIMIMTQLDEAAAAEHGIQLEPGEQAVQLTHAKSSYSAPTAPLFFVRRPGPVLEHVRSRDVRDDEEARLLGYLAERTEQGEPASTRQVVRDCEWHRVSSRNASKTLKRLADAGRIKPERVKCRGGFRTVWIVADTGDTQSGKLRVTSGAV